LILALAVILALGVTGGVFAYFTDVETSSDNSFKAGTLDLEIKDNGTWDPDPWGNGVDMTWVMDNMVPGGSSVTNHVFLRNVGSIAGNHVEISFSNAIDEATNPVESDSNPASLPQDLAKWIEIDSMSYAIYNLKVNIKSLTGWDINGNGWLDLDDVVRSPVIIAEHGPLDDLVPPDSVGGEASFSMSLYFRPEATNDIQGDILITTVSFTLNQNGSQ
jgi:predicted ribosomally synthesized peptide with SipW-like signal peptide